MFYCLLVICLVAPVLKGALELELLFIMEEALCSSGVVENSYLYLQRGSLQRSILFFKATLLVVAMTDTFSLLFSILAVCLQLFLSI